ncbi:FAD-dependent oxidoreductase [Streptomyces sp. 891-h]|uniref:NAD(P)/FAD-dependent oxidoreductase n=1 Tax=Streptomyces sp. 891-h TaxID=2720714 RepID=UPI001FA961E0|nr:FAD-dependent oxidoreductase [Streptomyces sp. 891-h]UNZ16908.1 FAD-dependent oxidoreductase [Streptomyces sp. 891-h]
MRVVVIGAGIVGAAAAYELVRAGAEAVLVDAVHEGRATAAGAGIICPWTGRVADPLAVAGAGHYPGLLAALAEDGRTDVGHRKVGALVLLPPDGEAAEQVRTRVTARAAADPHAGEVTTVDAAEARRLFPALGHSGGGFAGTALHLSGAARLDGRRLQAALVAAAERHGLRALSGTASLEVRDGRVRGVRVAGELVSADAVVAAAGAWSPALLGPAGVHIDVVPQRGQIVHLRLPGSDTSDWPVVLPSGSGHYLLTFDDSRVVVGATREDGTGFDHRVTAGGLAEVLRHALAVAPRLADATHLENRVGFRPTSPDGQPLLGTVAALEGLVVANGLGSGGLTAGPYAGTVAARLALGRAPEPDPAVELDLSPYDPMRFAPA